MTPSFRRIGHLSYSNITTRTRDLQTLVQQLCISAWRTAPESTVPASPEGSCWGAQA
jgi:hypothetical protein